jgi:hypothetical protein
MSTHPKPDATALITRLVLGALALVAVVVLVRRLFWPPEPRSYLGGGLKQLSLQPHHVDPADWRAQAQAELQEALDARDLRHEGVRHRLEAMTAEERQRILTGLPASHPHVRYTIPTEILGANLGHPNLSKLIQREDVLQAFGTSHWDRLPWHRRRELYRQFALLTGSQEPWSLLVPFDDLGGKEMFQALAAVQLGERCGLETLEKGQRDLVLRAGSVDWFGRMLKREEGSIK